MKRGRTYDWIPLWIDKWLWGSTRHELMPAERSIWIDLMVLAAKDDGNIRANETTGYPTPQLAGMFCVSIEELESTIEKCIEHGKLKKLGNGILFIINWKEYSLSLRHKKRVMSRLPRHRVTVNGPVYMSKSMSKSKSSKEDKEKIKAIRCAVIEYLNERTGKKFNPESKTTIHLINARLEEGRTLEDFKRVINIKVGKWKDDPKMDDYLRPETLFNRTKMEAYLNEKPSGELVGVKPNEPEWLKKGWAAHEKRKRAEEEKESKS